MTAAATPAPSTREHIVRTASRLFAERGYADVTVRDVAAAAAVSPALVIKLMGSKEALFRTAAEFEPAAIPLDVPRAELGDALVRDLLDRVDRGEPEPLVRAVVLLLPAPDPDEIRERFAAAYVGPLARRLGGDADAARRAELVVTTLVGLAVSRRMLRRLTPDTIDPADLRTAYGALVQSLIDDRPPHHAEADETIRSRRAE